MHSKKIALLAKEAAEDKKAEDAVVLDLAKLSTIAHYFVITHGNSDRHVRAIARNIADTLEKKGIRLLHREGMEAGLWILLDYGSVIVHIFYRDIRGFYGLERLWGEAPRL